MREGSPSFLHSPPIGVAIIGCGYMGKKRSGAIKHSGMGTLVGVFDTDLCQARSLAETHGAKVFESPTQVWHDNQVGIVIIATPHASLAPYAIGAIESRKHVLVEKPGATTLEEIEKIQKALSKTPLVRCKVGYHLRFHQAAESIHKHLTSNPDDRVLWLRGAYGHGGRPGYEKQWRFQKEISGGGEIIDQGVHLLDLFSWWVPEPFSVIATSRQNAFYQSTQEDNGFLILKSQRGTHAHFHCSATQWKNLFRMEIATQNFLYIWEGLGNANYGPEKLTVIQRNPRGGVPEQTSQEFQRNADESFTEEWRHFYLSLFPPYPRLLSSLEESFQIFQALEAIHQNIPSSLIP